MLGGRIVRRRNQLQIQPPGAGDPPERGYRRLAATVCVGAQDGAVEAGTSCQLGLTEPAAGLDLCDQLCGKVVLESRHEVRLANTPTYFLIR